MNVVILGSTGSLGMQTLEVLSKYPQNFKVIGLSANTNEKLLKDQAQKLDIASKNILLTGNGKSAELVNLATLPQADIIVNVLSGLSGIEPTKAALSVGKIVLLGNKEALVAAGDEIMPLASDRLIPVDSEHNAIFEILKKFPTQSPRKIILPCSGGPFLNKTTSELRKVSADEAINHPRWNMGSKISLESATLINKGLEIVEAHYLFNIPIENIEVVIHPECRIHGVVEFENGSAYAYISPPDMREHIENAFRHVLKKETARSKIGLFHREDYFLREPDHQTFPGIRIVLENFQKNRSRMTRFLQKEEEVLQRFLSGRITFPEIFTLLSPL